MPSFDTHAPAQTPKALYRRRSGYARRASSLAKLNRTDAIQRKSSPRFPPEILDRIVLLAIGSSASRSFTAIASFSLASFNFRQIAFRCFFSILPVKSNAHWYSLYVFLGDVNMSSLHPVETGYLLVRSIHIKSSILATRFAYLDAFLHLRSLSIVFSEGLATQHECAKLIFDRSFPFRLESLTLTCLSRIDVPLLNIIAARFPCLVSLVLSCTQRLDSGCCWGCLEDSASSTIHSPIPDMFPTSEDLAIAFSRALEPLTNLTHLHLGIFLSKESYLVSHFNHEEVYAELCGPEFCATCNEVCNAEDVPDAVRTREREASIIIARKLKKLAKVGWSSFFPSSDVCDTEGADKERATTLFIRREDGGIEARGQPW